MSSIAPPVVTRTASEERCRVVMTSYLKYRPAPAIPEPTRPLPAPLLRWSWSSLAKERRGQAKTLLRQNPLVTLRSRHNWQYVVRQHHPAGDYESPRTHVRRRPPGTVRQAKAALLSGLDPRSAVVLAGRLLRSRRSHPGLDPRPVQALVP